MARIKGNDGPNRLTGTKNGDEIYGNGGADEISGLGGDDRIFGGDGNDKAFGGAGLDRITGGLGDDVVDGGEGNDNLHGDSTGLDGVPNWQLELVGGTDWLYGGAGNDVLVGQYGGDHLWGGSGADMFGFNQFTNSNTQTGIDRIYDFNPGEGDTLYVSNAADADPQLAGRQNYQYVGSSKASGQENVATLTPYDTNGDGSSDGTILRLYADADDAAELTVDLVGYTPGANPIAGMTDFLFI